MQISLVGARANAGFTQEYVAKKLNIGKQTLINWEKGITEPKISQMRALSNLYDIPIDNIFLPIKSN